MSNTAVQPSEMTAPPPFANAPITDTDEAVRRIQDLLSPPEPVTKSEPAPVAEEDAAPVEQPSSEEAPASEPGDDLPPIAPPASWSADAKDVFRNLPRELQETVAKRETERDAETRRVQNETAEARKAIEAEKAQALQERQQYAQRLQTLVPALEKEVLADDFGRLTPEQRLQFARENPAEFQVRREQFEQKLALLNQAHQERQVLEQRQAQEQARTIQETLARERQLMAEKYPEFVDEKTGPQKVAEVKSYLKKVGFNDEEIGKLYDHRLVGVLRDAIRGAALSNQKAVADKKVVALPKVSKPGAVQDQGAVNAQKKGHLLKIMRESSDTNEQAAALAQFL